MNKLSKLKLNEISFESLKEKEMRQVKGGEVCMCLSAPNGYCTGYTFLNTTITLRPGGYYPCG